MKQYLEIFKKHFTFLKMLSSEFMQFKLYFVSSDCYYHEVVISTNDRRQFKCLNWTSYCYFSKKLRFKSRKKKNIDILNSSLYFRKQNMKLWTNEILTQYLKSSTLFFSWNQKFTKKLEAAELFWII